MRIIKKIKTRLFREPSPFIRFIIYPVTAGVLTAVIIYLAIGNKNGRGPDGIEYVTASVDNSKPIYGSTVLVTVNVLNKKDNPISGALVKAEANYLKPEDPLTEESDDFGKAKFSFEASRFPIGYKVIIDVKAEKDGSEGFAKTSFIPTEKTKLAKESYYIGNKNTEVFHRPSCGHLPLPKNRTYFNTRDEAISAEYRPCLHCKP